MFSFISYIAALLFSAYPDGKKLDMKNIRIKEKKREKAQINTRLRMLNIQLDKDEAMTPLSNFFLDQPMSDEWMWQKFWKKVACESFL